VRGKVLIVEDTAELAELYSVYLEREGFECRISGDAETALPLAMDHDWDIIVLDLNLPGMDGFQFLEQLRKTRSTPVMILTAREADEDVIHGLGVGADDFVTKPCPPRVLAARVRAHVRRTESIQSGRDGQVWRFGPFELDAEAHSVSRAGVPVNLSSREMGILEALAQAGGKPLTPDELYDRVWGQSFGDVSAVGVYIQRLRRKIEDDPAAPHYLQTMYGQGYRLNPEAFSREV